MKIISNRFKQLVLASALSAVAGGAIAATNPAGPTLGSSQGDFGVTLNKQDKIIINNFQDMVLAQFIESGTGDYVGSQNVCVGRAGASGGSAASYAITASNAAGDFKLNGSDGNGPVNTKISYKVFFNNAVEGVQNFGSQTELKNGIQDVSFNTNLAETECTTGTVNSTIWVKANGGEIDTAAPGVYTDTVTVTVAVN